MISSVGLILNFIRMELEKILNDALNKALCSKNRIQHPNSNTIAEFVSNYLEAINYSRSCETLKKNETLSWDDWKKENNYKWVAEKTYYNGVKTLSLKQLMKEYQNYCISL